MNHPGQIQQRCTGNGQKNKFPSLRTRRQKIFMIVRHRHQKSLARFQRVNGENNTDFTVYKDEIKNSYLILVKKKWKSFRNQVTFLKLFSKKQQEQLKELIKAENVDFDQPEEVLKFWDKVCLELH